MASENKSPTLAPTSGELIRPPSASTDLCHVTEEDNRARGCCTAATGHKSGNSLSLSSRSLKPEEEGYQSNTPGGGVGPRDQGHGNHPSTSAKEEGEDGADGRSSKEDRQSY
jgi:hypothetical protein